MQDKINNNLEEKSKTINSNNKKSFTDMQTESYKLLRRIKSLDKEVIGIAPKDKCTYTKTEQNELILQSNNYDEFSVKTFKKFNKFSTNSLSNKNQRNIFSDEKKTMSNSMRNTSRKIVKSNGKNDKEKEEIISHCNDIESHNELICKPSVTQNKKNLNHLLLFTPQAPINRYSINNFQTEKTNFKQRYINENIRYDSDCSCLIRSSSTVFQQKNSLQSKIIDVGSNNDNINNPFEMNNNNNLNNFNKENKENNNNNVNNEHTNSQIKATISYLQFFQKGVLLFNNQKFEDSFNYLLSHKIIKSLNEFAEILLISNDFDKDLIGKLLVKDNLSINKNYSLCKLFIKQINFMDIPLLNSLRFLLQRMNLPIDAYAILKIIEIFSEIYYEDNKHSNNFKDANSIYLLCNTILALNTMLMRKDLNMNIITLEEFIGMNDNVNEDIVRNIYKELEVNPLDLVYEYTEMFNKKLTVITSLEFNNRNNNTKSKSNLYNINEEDNNINSKNESSSINKNNENNISQSKATNADFNVNNSVIFEEISVDNDEGSSLISLLEKGNNFIKYGTNNYSHKKKFVYLNKIENKICWKNAKICNKCKLFRLMFCDKTKFIYVKDIVDIYYGTGYSKCFEKYNIKLQREPFYFSIETKYRTLDLQNDSIDVCKTWYKGIKFLLQQNKKIDPDKNTNCSNNEYSNEYNHNLNKLNNIEEDNIKENDNRKCPKYNNSLLDEKLNLFWENEIIKNWDFYYNSISSSNNNDDYSSIKNYKSLTQKEILKMIDLSKIKKLSPKLKINNFYYLYVSYGIPFYFRRRIWEMIIGNKININNQFIPLSNLKNQIATTNNNQNENCTENIDNNFLLGLDQIIIDKINKEINSCYEKNKKYIFSPSNNINNKFFNKNNNNNGINAYNINNQSSIINNNTSYESNKQYSDNIITIIKKLDRETYSERIKNIINSVIFSNRELNLNYSKIMLYYAIMFLLIDNDQKTCFCLFNNFLNNKKMNFTIKLLLYDFNFINRRTEFFDKCFENYLPKLYNHFRQIEIESQLFFHKWINFIFIRYFIYKKDFNTLYEQKPFEIIFKIWDVLLIKGEVYIYEIALAILFLLERKLLNLPNYRILKMLNHFPYELIGETTLFNQIKNIDLNKEFTIFQEEKI